MRSAEWADHRARALAMSRVDVVRGCGQRWREVRCGCSTIQTRVGCDQPQLCMRCRVKHSRKWRGRIVEGIEHGLKRERARWYGTSRERRRGMRPGVYLITLTAPHSGDLERDRKSMGRAVRKMLKHATAAKWWRVYALTWEATKGTVGDGHLHCHMAVISSWVPYTSEQVKGERAEVRDRRGRPTKRGRMGLRELWADVCPGALVVDVKAPGQASNAAYSAGRYLAKYVTKGVDPVEFTGRKAGELLVAFRGRRKVTTSAGFWRPRHGACESCKERYRLTLTPCSLQDLMPGAVLRSQGVRYRFRAWEQDELYAPWEWRPPSRAPAEPAPRPSKMNRPSRWVLTRGPSEWAEPVSLDGWKPQHFEKA
jgi:hypothetical protein